MFYVMTCRIVKQNLMPKEADRYAPRTENRILWGFSGPFTKRLRAEKVAAGLLGAHTTSTAVVMTRDAVERLTCDAAAGYDAIRAAQFALRMTADQDGPQVPKAKTVTPTLDELLADDRP